MRPNFIMCFSCAINVAGVSGCWLVWAQQPFPISTSDTYNYSATLYSISCFSMAFRCTIINALSGLSSESNNRLRHRLLHSPFSSGVLSTILRFSTCCSNILSYISDLFPSIFLATFLCLFPPLTKTTHVDLLLPSLPIRQGLGMKADTIGSQADKSCSGIRQSSPLIVVGSILSYVGFPSVSLRTFTLPPFFVSSLGSS